MVIVNAMPFAGATDITAITVINFMPRPVVLDFSNGTKASCEAPMSRTILGCDSFVNATVFHAGEKLRGMISCNLCSPWHQQKACFLPQ